MKKEILKKLIMIGIIKKVLLVTVFVFSNSLIAQVDRSVMPESGPAPEIKFGTPKTFLLDNGLTVMVVENSKLPRASATLNFNKSKDAGLTFVKYYGDVIPTTRDLCRRMVNGQLNKRKNGLFTIAEIQDIWAGRSWSGKKGGNPMIVRGGYNCRHQFSYVNPDWYNKKGELII